MIYNKILFTVSILFFQKNALSNAGTIKIKSLEDKKELFTVLGIDYSDELKFSNEASWLKNIERKDLFFKKKIDIKDNDRVLFLRESIEKKRKARLTLSYDSEKKEISVLSGENIKKGDFIIEVIGEVIKNIKKNETAWKYPCGEGGFGKKNESFFISHSIICNESRFIRKTNNGALANTRPCMIYTNKSFHLAYIAEKDISEGEEVIVLVS